MLLRLFSLVCTVLAVANGFVISPPSNDIAYSYALDLSQLTSTSSFSCIRQNGYTVAFIRVYSPANGGAVDPNGCANIQNAYSANLGTEIYVTPQPSSSKAGYQQFDEFYNNLKQNGITVRTVWLQVTSPVNWPNTPTTNQNFISSFVSRGGQYGISVGIYTSSYDWQQITASWTGLQTSVQLWYWNVFGSGVSGESPTTFDDFRSFGNWNQPAVKQFGQLESVCSIAVNRDVYPSSNLAKQRLEEEIVARQKAHQIVVGGLFH